MIFNLEVLVDTTFIIIVLCFSIGESCGDIYMKSLRIYQCEDSVDGIFSAIYEAGISGYGHKYIRIQPLVEGEAVNLELFSEYISVETDSQKTEKVLKAIYEKISPRAYSEVMWAIISEEADRGDDIYQFNT